MLVEEFEFGVRPSLWDLRRSGQTIDDNLKIPIEGHTDADDLVKASRSLVFAKGIGKRRKTDVCDIQEMQDLGFLRELTKIAGPTNPANAGTKKLTFEDQTMVRLREVAMGYYDVHF